MKEDDLFRAMARPGRERHRCACRGELVADPTSPEEVASAIYADRQTERHQAWREWMIAAGQLLSDEELTALQPKLRRVG